MTAVARHNVNASVIAIACLAFVRRVGVMESGTFTAFVKVLSFDRARQFNLTLVCAAWVSGSNRTNTLIGITLSVIHNGLEVVFNIADRSIFGLVCSVLCL